MTKERRGQLAREVLEQAEKSVLRDQWLIPLVFRVLHGKDVHAIASESFIGKSKKRYNTAWLAREIVQNFVDANPVDHQTINGVNIEVIDLPKSKSMPKGGKQFVVTGDWKFAKPTALISPDSDKADDRQTAGGNGIGLKQAALLLYRDFNVQKFEIVGEKWRVAYSMTDKNAINAELSAAAAEHNAEPVGEVDKDWLIAELSKDANSNKNSYIIETDNTEVIAALEQLNVVGVSKENPYLQNLDFENKYGSIKWLLPAIGEKPARVAASKNPTVEKGALFINGQIMNFKTEGKTAADYWQGPELVTVRLNNVKYNMSIDRPPVNQYDLGSYMDELISSMNNNEMIGQLKKTEPLWTTRRDNIYKYNREGCFVIIEKLVEQLYQSSSGVRFEKIFPDKPYLAMDISSGGEDENKLVEKGFILCPEYFAKIGMPRASSKIERPPQKKSDPTEYKPDEAVADRRTLAMEKGMDVYGEDLTEIKNSKEFFGEVIQRFKFLKPKFEIVTEKANTLRAIFDIDIPEALLFHQLPRPLKGDAAQGLLFFIRGAIEKGLEEYYFEDVHTEQKGYFSNYKLRKDAVTKHGVLLVRHVEHKGDRPFTFEFSVQSKYFAEVQEAVAQDFKLTKTTANESGKEVRNKSRKPPRAWVARLRELAPVAGLIALLGGGAAGVVKYGGDHGADSAGQTELPKDKSKDKSGGFSFSWPGIGTEGGGSGGLYKELNGAAMKKNLEQAAGLKGIDGLLESLKQLASKNQMEAAAAQNITPTGEYLKWKGSGDFYGSLIKNKTGYIGSSSLLGLLAEYNQSDVPANQHDSSHGGGLPGFFGTSSVGEGGGEGAVEISKQLMQIANSLNPDDDPVQHFEIVTQPSQTELAQLAVLRTYFELTTGVQVSNDLFIFNGTGATGINMGGRAIGIHRNVLKTRFFEAMQTVTHEVAHNNRSAHGHDQGFVRTEEALFSREAETLDTLAEKAAKQQRLTANEKVVTDLENQWEELRRGTVR